MERNNKQHLCIGLFLFVTVTCLLLCHFSFRDAVAPQPTGNQFQMQYADNYNDTVTMGTALAVEQAAIIDTWAGGSILPSNLNLRAALSMKVRAGQFRNLINHIFAVLFKTVCIPTFIFVIMGNCLHTQTSLLQYILQYIQAKDGKKQVA